MNANSQRAFLLDAGPLIHLDELNCLDLFGLFPEVLIPAEVWEEALRHRVNLRLQAIPRALVLEAAPVPTPQVRLAMLSFKLQRGEIAALTWLELLGGGVLVSDDSAARAAAEAQGCEAVGSLGLILIGCHAGQRTPTEARRLFISLPQRSTLHVSQALVARLIASLPQ